MFILEQLTHSVFACAHHAAAGSGNRHDGCAITKSGTPCLPGFHVNEQSRVKAYDSNISKWLCEFLLYRNLQWKNCFLVLQNTLRFTRVLYSSVPAHNFQWLQNWHISIVWPIRKSAGMVLIMTFKRQPMRKSLKKVLFFPFFSIEGLMGYLLYSFFYGIKEGIFEVVLCCGGPHITSALQQNEWMNNLTGCWWQQAA